MLKSKPLRKKGGIIIKNKIIFLITILSILFINILNVNAEEATFYEGEYLDDIYMSKYEYSSNTIYYQKARIFRKSDTNEFVYCVEPFNFYVDGSIYETTDHITHLSDNQIERIKQIAHFGYNYDNHTDIKWYAITQMMIWKEAGSNLGDFYFTDTLNGNRIEPFNNEIEEIESLITNYNITPISSDTIYTVMEGKSMGIIVNKDIDKYVSDSEHIVIKNGNIEIKNLTEGYYEFTLTRNEQENNPIIFFHSNNSQTLMSFGGISNKSILLKVNVEKGSITIHKTDEETGETPQGEAELDGAVYGLYKGRRLITEVTINNNQAIIENPDYGTYTLKEITPGKGYTLNEEPYSVSINFQTLRTEVEVTNKVIEKNIKIIKKYGEEDNLIGESDIVFEIYNNINELVDSIITNENGEANIILPYGTYIIKQINSSPGYQKVDDININVEDIEEEIIELVDQKIPVPNTYHVEYSLLVKLIDLIIQLLC